MRCFCILFVLHRSPVIYFKLLILAMLSQPALKFIHFLFGASRLSEGSLHFGRAR